MKYIFLLLITYTITSFACSGDCMQCHPVLQKSIEKEHHKILKTCINCHTKVPEGMVSCGGDCFSCHSQNKLIKSARAEHQNLASCKECHVNKEDILNFGKKSLNENDGLLEMMKSK